MAELLKRRAATFTSVALYLFASALNCAAQVQKAAAPAFEVVSVKHSGDLQSHIGAARGAWREVEFKGHRLFGEAPLRSYIQFACSPLVTPYRDEYPQWVHAEFYQIEAIAPPGTTLDGARAMLRKVLAERLGVQYHLIDRELPVYLLVRGNGQLKLSPSTNPHIEARYNSHGLGGFKSESATLADFAGFLSSVAGRIVVDKTAIRGLYRFDIDWSKEIMEEMATQPNSGIDPGIALREVRDLGLRLEPGKEMRKVLIVDHANREPTPN